MSTIVKFTQCLVLAGLWFAPANLIAAQPAVSMMTTCTMLTGNLYPADSVNWFYPDKHSQVVFFTHLLFPLDSIAAAKVVSPKAGLPLKSWHPPLVHPGGGPSDIFDDNFYAEAKWMAPDGSKVAHYGLTMPARAEKDYQRLGSQTFAPHTFAMAAGTQDIRAGSGQTAALNKPGQYRIEFLLDGKLAGISFFRIMVPGEAEKLSPTVKIK